MAITFGPLFDQVVSFENLWEAYRKARRGKRYSEAAAHFDMEAEGNVLRLCEELRTDSYRPGPYSHFFVNEPKRRLISAAPFRDRVVHHAVVNVLEPLYERRFSNASYACRRDKGQHRAMERAHWGIRNCPWFLKGDIVKFFPSVDHGVLLAILGKKVKDPKLMRLVARIVESGRSVPNDAPVFWFCGDDLLAPVERLRGLPIGNLTSQFFANVLLNELDQFVHGHIKPREYVRYGDDFILFDREKEKLIRALSDIRGKMDELRLRLHNDKTQIRRSTQGVGYLGFRLLPTTRRIARESISRFRRRMKVCARVRPLDLRRVGASVRGWVAHTEHANATAMVKEVLSDLVFSPA